MLFIHSPSQPTVLGVCWCRHRRGGRTPLSWAAVGNSQTVIKILIDHGADANFQNLQGHTPLMTAVMSGSADAAKALLSSGADTELRNNEGQSAFDLALAYNHPELVTLQADKDEQ